MNTNELTTLIQSGEGERLEFKERWNEAALTTLAAFANTQGGAVLVGVSDDGHSVGWTGSDRDLQAIADQTADSLRIQPSVTVQAYQGQKVLVIRTGTSLVPVAYRGRYYRRIGNTTREIAPEELGRFFVARLGVKWDSIPGDYGPEALDPETVQAFVRSAHKRLPYLREDEPIQSILAKLDLLREGKLTRGALLLFGQQPQQLFLSGSIHMGRFKDAITIVDDKLLRGNLFQQLEQAMQLFRQYLQVRYAIPSAVGEGTMVDAVRRHEQWDYPLEALREAVVNALVHRDYFETGMDTQIRVYEDRVVISNPGGLPEGMTTEELRHEGHRSIPRNPLLAQVFYYAELAEKWGTGTTRMIRRCLDEGLPEPTFEANGSTFQVTLSKDPYTDERLRQLGLSERQIRAVLWSKEHGSISNQEYQTLSGVSERTATRDLAELVRQEILTQVGRTGKGTTYRLRGIPKPPMTPR